MERVEGGYIAPIRIRIVYARQGGRETRESTISFRLNEAQRVVEALDKPRIARGGRSPGRTSPLRR
jgi:hypothetical protein